MLTLPQAKPKVLSKKFQKLFMLNELSRRRFLSQAGAGISAAWRTAHWPQIVSAADTRPPDRGQSHAAYKFEFFTPAEAAEIEAMAARIIPTDDTPGAREAGVIYFIDRALMTFADRRPAKISRRLPGIAERRARKIPCSGKVFRGDSRAAGRSCAVHGRDPSPKKVDAAQKSARRRMTFFEAVRIATIAGFLIDPEAEQAIAAAWDGN